MGFSRAIVAGTVLGGVAATGIYVAVAAPAPSTTTPAARSAAVSPELADALRPRAVPTFTRVVPAPCTAPAVLVAGTCVTHVAGRPTVLPAPPAAPAGARQPRTVTAPAAVASPSTPTGTPAATGPSAGEREDADAAEDAEHEGEDPGHEDGEGEHGDDDAGAHAGG